MPSPQASKRKGAKYEGELRDWLTGRLAVPPRGLGNARPLVVEAKNEKEMHLAQYVREAKTEMANATADHWVVVIRKRGSTDVGQSYVLLDLDEYLRQVPVVRGQIERIRLSGPQDRGDLTGVYLLP